MYQDNTGVQVTIKFTAKRFRSFPHAAHADTPTRRSRPSRFYIREIKLRFPRDRIWY